MHRVHPDRFGRREVTQKDRACGVSDVDKFDDLARKSIEILDQDVVSELIDDHHFVNRIVAVAERRIDHSEQLRTVRVCEVDDVNAAAVAAAEITSGTDHDRFEKLLIRSRVVPARQNRCVGVRNVVDEGSAAIIASLHRDVAVSVDVGKFQIRRAAAIWRDL